MVAKRKEVIRFENSIEDSKIERKEPEGMSSWTISVLNTCMYACKNLLGVVRSKSEKGILFGECKCAYVSLVTTEQREGTSRKIWIPSKGSDLPTSFSNSVRGFFSLSNKLPREKNIFLSSVDFLKIRQISYFLSFEYLYRGCFWRVRPRQSSLKMSSNKNKSSEW